MSRKIFVIGPNKCGTTSLHDFFLRNGLKSIHWGGGTSSTNIALRMQTNLDRGSPLLSGMEGYDCFTDINFFQDNHYLPFSQSRLTEMYREYPDAYYILNTRPTDQWLLSRLRHTDLAERCMKSLNTDISGLIQTWTHEKETFERVAPQVLKGAKLLIFDITRNTGHDLKAFLSPHFTLRTTQLNRLNRTKR